MADVRVMVTKTFEYRGRTARRGSTLPMAPLDAAMAARTGHVTLVSGAVVEPDPEPVMARVRRRYRRRDMAAEG
jgi:hypothetical protein